MTAMVTSPATAATDYCQYGKQTTLVLLDRTTPYTGAEQETLIDGVATVYEQLRAGERLLVRTLVDDHTESRTAFDSCMAKCPSDQGFVAWLLSSCSSVRAKRERVQQMRGLAEAVKPMIETRHATPESAVARSIGTAAEEIRVMASQGRAQPLGRLVIYSDLIQNTDAFPAAAFKRAAPAEAVRRLDELGVDPGFAGVDVLVFGFGRDQTAAREALPPGVAQRLKRTWRRFFASNGAASVRITRKYGL